MKRVLAKTTTVLLAFLMFILFSVICFASGNPSIICKNVSGKAGDRIEIEVSVENNPGIMYLELTPIYSKELGAPTIKNGNVFSDITIGKQIIWTSDTDNHNNGKLITFFFDLPKDIPLGDYSFDLILRGAYNYNEESVLFNVKKADIKVSSNNSNTSFLFVLLPVAITLIAIIVIATLLFIKKRKRHTMNDCA